MPDTYPPPKTERKSIIPVLAQRISTIPTVVRERVSDFFEKPAEPPKSKQGILTDFLVEIVPPQTIADILMGRCYDKKLLEGLEMKARIAHPDAAQFLREKIESIDSVIK